MKKNKDSKVKNIKQKENQKTKKNKDKKENKNINNNIIKKRFKIISFICLLIVAIELIIMLIMYLSRENKITYIDTLNSIQSIDDKYYLAAGSSNFKHSQYNSPRFYEYQLEDEDEKRNIYAEQAKLVKYDNELNIVFEKTFVSDYDSTFYDAVAVSDGYIAVGSYIYEKKQIDLNTRDGLIVKYDLDGNVVWNKNYQVLGDTEFKKVMLVDDGIIVIGQSIYENMEIGNHPTGGGIIIKYDLEGNLIWTNNYGGNKSGIFNDVIKLEDGYIACGKDAKNYGMLVKFDLEGNHLWTKNYSNTDTIGMTGIKLKDNKLYISGALNISDEKNENDEIIYNYDACIFVYDLEGNLIDTYTIGGIGDDHFSSILLKEDKIIAVGYTKSKDIDIKDIPYKENMATGIIVIFDYEGKVLDKTYYGGTNNDILTDIIDANLETENKVNSTNDYIVIGYSNSKTGLFKGNNKDYYGRILKYNQDFDLLIEN